VKRIALGSLLLAGCSIGQPSEQYGFLTTLGRDTIAVENVTHKGNEVTIEAVDRFPRVRH